MSYPDYTRNPNDSDVQTFLTAAGLWSTLVATVYYGQAASAVKQFQNRTGRIPFLAGSEADYYFDPPGDTSAAYNYPWRGGEKILELDTAFATITEVATGCTTDAPTGNLLTINSNCFLRPNQAVLKGLPYEWLEFTFPVWGAYRSVRVKGRAGSYTVWPEDAWYAVIMGACLEMKGTIVAGLTGGAESIKDDDQSIDFGSSDRGGFAAIFGAWDKKFNEAVDRYQFVRVGLS